MTMTVNTHMPDCEHTGSYLNDRRQLPWLSVPMLLTVVESTHHHLPHLHTTTLYLEVQIRSDNEVSRYLPTFRYQVP